MRSGLGALVWLGEAGAASSEDQPGTSEPKLRGEGLGVPVPLSRPMTCRTGYFWHLNMQAPWDPLAQPSGCK